MSLTLRDIRYTYSAGEALEQVALAGVSLDVNPGRVVLVAGATGSGKSTLLRVAAGLITPTAGEATIDGAALEARTARGRIGLVFQSPEQQLFGDTVLDDVAFGPRNLGVGHDAALDVAREALLEVRLDPDEFAQRSPFGLSGGQARRAAIAGVLAMRTDYLLLDEPSAGLDAPSRDMLRDVIVRARDRAGVVIVSHDLDEFLPIADDVLLLAEGRPTFSGTLAELLESPGAFADAGLVPSPVLQAQLAARDAGLEIGELTLDVDAAADALVAAALRAKGAGR